MAKPFISLFDVTPNTINRGDKVVFRWGVSNATTRHLTDKGSIGPVGSWTTYPTSTKTYTLTAGNPEGTSKKFQTVTVIQPPPPPPKPPEPPPEPPEPPPPGECPDFWEDPIGWVLCTLTNGFSVFVEWFGTSFWTFIDSLQQWAAGFTLEFWQFLQDPVSKIQTWMNGVFVAIQDLSSQISSSISTWWNQTVIDVGVMITNATTGFQSWIDERFTGINEWWADAQTVWGTFWNERIKGVEDFINDFSTKVNNWYNTKIQPTIDAIQSRLNDFGDYIKGIPDLLSRWWNDRVIEVGVWITEATTAANDWITGFPDLIGNWWNDRVIEIGIWLADRDNEFNLWVKNILPGIVGNMFEWAKPVIQPIMDAVGFLGQIVGIVTGTAPESESVKSVKENYKTQTDRVNEILGRP